MYHREGGELFDHILAHKYLREKDARRLFAQLISGVSYLHQKQIVHRDLKLENLLLDRNRNVIITDFGFANNFGDRSNDLMATSCGSPCYAAPELVVQDGLYNGSSVDIWSCGVILYAMLAGYLPFDDDPANPDSDNIHRLYHYILETPITFPEYVSRLPRDLLRRMLVPDPTRRATMEEVMSHPWLVDYSPLFSFSLEDLEHAAVEQQARKRQIYRQQMELQQQLLREPPQAVLAGSSRGRSGTVSDVPAAHPNYRRTAMPTAASALLASEPETKESIKAAATQINRHTLQVEYSAPPSMASADPMGIVTATISERMLVGTSQEKDPTPMAVDHGITGAAEPPLARSGFDKASTLELVHATERDVDPELEKESAVASAAAAGSTASTALSDRMDSTPKAAPVNVPGPTPILTAEHMNPQESDASHTAPDTTTANMPLILPHDRTAKDKLPVKQPSNASGIVLLVPAPPSPGPEPMSTGPVVVASASSALDTPKKEEPSKLTNAETRARSASLSAGGPMQDRRRLSLLSFNSRTRGNTLLSRFLPYRSISPQPVPETDASELPSKATHISAQSSSITTRRRGNTVTRPIDLEDKKPSRTRRKTMSLIPSRLSEKERKTAVRSVQDSGNELLVQNVKHPDPASPLSLLASSTTPPASAAASIKPEDPPPSATASISPPRSTVASALASASESVKPDSSLKSSTGAAKRVMDWFRGRSRHHSADTPSVSSHVPHAEVNGPSQDAHKGPAEVKSERADVESLSRKASAQPKGQSSPAGTGPGSEASRDTNLTAPLLDPSSAPPKTQSSQFLVPSSASGEKSLFSDTVLRYHEGAVDQRALMSISPPLMLIHVRQALTSMGIDFRLASQEEFKLECLRPKKTGRPALGSFGASLRTSVFPPSQTLLERSSRNLSPPLVPARVPSPAPPPGLPTGFRGFLRRGSLLPQVYAGPEGDARLGSMVSLSSSTPAGSPGVSSPAEAAGGVSPIYGEPSVDGGQEVRFSVEITRLKNLAGLYSVDIRRMRGNVWAYKFCYTALLQRCCRPEADSSNSKSNVNFDSNPSSTEPVV